MVLPLSAILLCEGSMNSLQASPELCNLDARLTSLQGAHSALLPPPCTGSLRAGPEHVVARGAACQTWAAACRGLEEPWTASAAGVQAWS